MNAIRVLSWVLAALVVGQTGPATHDIVLRNGRVLDPASNLDGIRQVGITGTKITALSTQPLRGRVEIDASGLVILSAPKGHGLTSLEYAVLRAHDAFLLHPHQTKQQDVDSRRREPNEQEHDTGDAESAGGAQGS